MILEYSIFCMFVGFKLKTQKQLPTSTHLHVKIDKHNFVRKLVLKSVQKLTEMLDSTEPSLFQIQSLSIGYFQGKL